MTKNLTWKMVKDNPLGAIEFLVESNRIEGIGDEGSAERYATLLCYEGYKNSDYQSALITHHKNSIRALKFVIQHHQEELTVKKILKLHAIQMEGTMPAQEGVARRFKAGVFREQPMYVNRKEKPLHTKIPKLMNEFLGEFNDKEIAFAPIVPLHTHYHFECIHPFIDGNGRVGRLLWLWDVLRHRGNIHPILNHHIKDWNRDFYTERKSYYNAIREYEKQRGWAPKDDEKEKEQRLDALAVTAAQFMAEESTSRRNK